MSSANAPARKAPGAARAGPSAANTCTLRFRTHFWTKPGDTVKVVGSHSQLGKWSVDRAVQLRWAGEGFWTADVTTLAGTAFEYKYVVDHGFGNVEWEAGGNRYLPGVTGRLVWVVDAWQTPSVGPLSSAALSFVLQPSAASAVVPPPAPRPSAAGDGSVVAVRFSVAALSGQVSVRGSWSDWDAGQPMAVAGAGRWETWIQVPASAFPLTYKYFDGERFEEGADRRLERPPGATALVSDGAFRKTWRAAGVSVPLFSVYSSTSVGCGDFGDLVTLVDWAADCGMQMLQLLPINDTSVYGTWRDSYPYNPLSVFALHPLYLSPALLGVDVAPADVPAPTAEGIDYEACLAAKWAVLRRAFAASGAALLASDEFAAFLGEHGDWLVPYAVFCALRDAYGTADYNRWPDYQAVDETQLRALAAPSSAHYEAVQLNYFAQYQLHVQMLAASRHAVARHVALKGDLPIGVSRHGVDAWFHRPLFKLNKQVGAPPDYFATLGQNWGFPAYNWDKMATDGYNWWCRRLRHLARYFQAYRIDHILGFFRIWEIPSHAVTGLLGKFYPIPPIWRDELVSRGVWDLDRLTRPYIRWWTLRETFGEAWYEITKPYVREHGGGFEMRPEFDTERKIEAAGLDKWFSHQLYSLVHNVVLLDDDNEPGHGFHPRIEMAKTSSFRDLDGGTQAVLRELYVEYFYRRPDDMWRESAMRKLPALKAATDMLVCGEDLGMIPDCVPGVMAELGILSLRIQRMPADDKVEFGDTRDPAQYPYAAVCATSTHDMSPVRAWFEADREAAQRFYNSVLGQQGVAPVTCTPEVARTVVYHHLESQCMFAVLPVQDYLAMDGDARAPDSQTEQINEPSNPIHYWRWRMHKSLEELQGMAAFSREVREAVGRTGRSVPVPVLH